MRAKDVKSVVASKHRSREKLHGVHTHHKSQSQLQSCSAVRISSRTVPVGCEDIPDFGEEVAEGKKVNIDLATPGIVKKAKWIKKSHPNVRAFLFECTELPMFSDAVRAATGLPVYRSITMADSFMSGVTDNKRFGLNEWHEDFDGKQKAYKFGDNLTDSEKEQITYGKSAP